MVYLCSRLCACVRGMYGVFVFVYVCVRVCVLDMYGVVVFVICMVYLCSCMCACVCVRDMYDVFVFVYACVRARDEQTHICVGMGCILHRNA